MDATTRINSRKANVFLGLEGQTQKMFKFTPLILIAVMGLASCRTAEPKPNRNIGAVPNYTPLPAELSLPDRTAFAQDDPRWAAHKMGGSGGSLASEGCLVTATAMALGNLGFHTDPADLNKRLKSSNGYTGRGLMVWSSIDKITDGKATARYYDNVSAEIIDGCMADGYYPLARFILPSGRSHWALILKKSKQGYHMRDPLHPSRRPLIFPKSVDAFKSVRCVGLNA